MSTAKRRRGQSLHLELRNGISEDLLPIAAAFIILFDIKAGYTIVWKQSISGLELTDSVEFKSLPSGLHNVKEDLIYFLHNDEYAGISAFINEPAANSERNALMLAVGALVPLSQGRLGRSWEHAQGLKDLARELVQDTSKTQPLEDFWEKYRWRDEAGSEQPALDHESSSSKEPERTSSDANGYARRRSRVLSTASALIQPGQFLPSHHPALSLPAFLDAFGPLIFPLYKAALLRKRILLVAHAPVEQTCNFVYDLSVLSNIPASISELLPLEPLPTRLQPLFSVGVHDIPTLHHGSRTSVKPANDEPTQDLGYGWVACTTDDVLAMKESLYDILVTIPPPYTAQAKEKVWPKIESPKGTEVKATQRDLRRYRTLRTGLRRYHPSTKSGDNSPTPSSHTPPHLNFSDEINDDSAPEPQTPLLPPLPLLFPNTQETFDDASSTISATLIEPQSWSALAYSSFMWWASAGEKRADIDAEIDHDAALLADNAQSMSPGQRRSSGNKRRDSSSRAAAGEGGGGGLGMEMERAVVAYFLRLTGLVLGGLAECVEAADEEGEEEEEEEEEESAPGSAGTEGGGRAEGAEGAGADERGPPVRGKVFVGSEDMARMGLDVWSEGDRKFVQELVGFYWGREAEVGGKGVELCGVRIC